MPELFNLSAPILKFPECRGAVAPSPPTHMDRRNTFQWTYQYCWKLKIDMKATLKYAEAILICWIATEQLGPGDCPAKVLQNSLNHGAKIPKNSPMYNNASHFVGTKKKLVWNCTIKCILYSCKATALRYRLLTRYSSTTKQIYNLYALWTLGIRNIISDTECVTPTLVS